MEYGTLSIRMVLITVKQIRREFSILTDAGILTPERAEQIRLEAFNASFDQVWRSKRKSLPVLQNLASVVYDLQQNQMFLTEYDRFLANGLWRYEVDGTVLTTKGKHTRVIAHFTDSCSAVLIIGTRDP